VNEAQVNKFTELIAVWYSIAFNQKAIGFVLHTKGLDYFEGVLKLFSFL
jgi:hypothetical protein